MIRALCKLFARDERGTPAIEAAFALPVLMTFIVGIVETSYYFFLASTLENSVLHASRFGVTGAGEDTQSVSRSALVRSVIHQQTFGRVPMDKIQIDTLVYDSFSNIGEPEPYVDMNENTVWDEGEPYTDVNGNGMWDADMAVLGLGGSGDIVLYRVSYQPPSLTGLADWATQRLTLAAAVAVRNEPF